MIPCVNNELYTSIGLGVLQHCLPVMLANITNTHSNHLISQEFERHLIDFSQKRRFFTSLLSMSLDPASQEAQDAVTTALRWLNMKVNQMKPFTLDSVQSVAREGDNIRMKVKLVTECFANQVFEFELVLNPAVNNPTALVEHKQLAP